MIKKGPSTNLLAVLVFKRQLEWATNLMPSLKSDFCKNNSENSVNELIVQNTHTNSLTVWKDSVG
jgi:hypothetical protein